MIIEIKDLPKDRSIKKITFDIEFEDGEIKSLKSIDKPKSEIVEKSEIVKMPEISENIQKSEISDNVKMPVIDISNRQPKIDDDIMNMEF